MGELAAAGGAGPAASLGGAQHGLRILAQRPRLAWRDPCSACLASRVLLAAPGANAPPGIIPPGPACSCRSKVGSQRFGGLVFNAFLQANQTMSTVGGWVGGWLGGPRGGHRRLLLLLLWGGCRCGWVGLAARPLLGPAAVRQRRVERLLGWRRRRCGPACGPRLQSHQPPPRDCPLAL